MSQNTSVHVKESGFEKCSEESRHVAKATGAQNVMKFHLYAN